MQQKEQEKLASIINSEADSESALLIGRAIERHGDGYLKLKRLEAQWQIASNLANSPNVSFIPGGPQVLLGLPP